MPRACLGGEENSCGGSDAKNCEFELAACTLVGRGGDKFCPGRCAYEVNCCGLAGCHCEGIIIMLFNI